MQTHGELRMKSRVVEAEGAATPEKTRTLRALVWFQR